MKSFKKLFTTLGILSMSLGLFTAFSQKDEAVKAEAESGCLGEFSFTSTISSVSPFGNANEFILLTVAGTDYPDVDGVVRQLSADETATWKTDIIDHMEVRNGDGNLVSVDIWESYINFWTRHTNLTLGCINGAAYETVTFKKGMKIPSYRYLTGEITEISWYELDANYIATRVGRQHIQNQEDAWTIEKEKTSGCIGEFTISSLYAVHVFGEDNGNEMYCFVIKDADYPNVDGVSYTWSADQLAAYKTNIKEHMTVTTTGGNAFTDFDIWEAYVNFWTRHTLVGLGFLNGVAFESITFEKGMKLPSYRYLKGEFTSDAWYELKDTVKATRVDHNKTTNSENAFTLEVVKEEEEEFEENKGAVAINSFQTIHPNVGDAAYAWFVIKDADYPDIDGQNANVEGEYYNALAAALLEGITLYDKDDEVITGVEVFQIVCNMWTHHTNFAIGLNKMNLAEKLVIKAGTKIPSYKTAKGIDPFSYYTIDQDYTLKRLDHAAAEGGSAFESWQVTRFFEETIDLYDELVSDDGFVFWGTQCENPDAAEADKVYGTQMYFPLNTVNMAPAGTTQSYFNDHGAEFPIDLMSFIYVNGVSMREAVMTNRETNEYTFLWGTMSSWYAPCYLAMINDPNMAFGVRLFLAISQEWMPMEGLTITVKPFEGYENTDGVGVYLSKEVSYKVFNNQMYRTCDAKFGDTVIKAPIGGSLPASYIPSAGEPREATEAATYQNVWAVKDSDPMVILDENYVFTGDVEFEVVEIETVRQYTVTFNSDNGEENETITVNYGSKVTRPEFDPEKEGYKFLGWYVGEELFDFDTPITSDVTIVAKWKEIVEVTVTFDTDGGSRMSPITVEQGETIEAPANPSKTGYTFDGWYLDGQLFDFNTPINEDITLVAHWTKVEEPETSEPETSEPGQNNEEPAKKGCGGSILAASGVIAFISLVGLGLAINKKKED